MKKLGKKMKNFIHIAMAFFLLFASSWANAETSLIKYKNYLIPIDVTKEVQITTEPASAITSSSARLNMRLIGGKSAVKVWFEFRQTSQPSCSQVAPSNAVDLLDGQAHQQTKTGLIPANDYYFRACAINDEGQSVAGEIANFRTLNAPTEVATFNASSITQVSATLNGKVLGGTNITTWFIYAQGNGAGLQCNTPQQPSQGNGNTNDARSLTIDSLTPDSRYSYKFCGLGSDRVFSGTIKRFDTLIETVLETRPATSIKRSSANVSGRVTSGSSIEVWFEHSEDSNLQCGTPKFPSYKNSNTGSLRQIQIRRLNSNTTYFYRFCGKGLDGTKGGNIESFTTEAEPTSLSFVNLTERTDDGATLTFKLMTGQGVKTWFVQSRNALPSNACSTFPKINQNTLNAGETSVYAATGLDDWARYDIAFCAESINGDLDSLARTFVTKRKVGEPYTRQCDDTVEYSSANGPLWFYVVTPPSPLYDHAVYEVNNDRSSNLTYYILGRTVNTNIIVSPNSQSRKSISPGFNSNNNGERFYTLRVFGEGPWTAKVGCFSQRIFNKTVEFEEGE